MSRMNESMPLLKHLSELRETLMRSLLALTLGMFVSIFWAPHCLNVLKKPLDKLAYDADELLIQLEVSGGFSIALTIIFWSGLIIATPFIFYFVGLFIFPGLKEKEKKLLTYAGLASGFLFIAGIWLAYHYSVTMALQFMFWVSDWMGVPPQKILLTNYISFVLRLLLAFGLIFQLPIGLFLAGYFDLIDANTIAEKRREIFIGILIVAMLLTPQDPFTMLLMAIPLYGLFELALWGVKRCDAESIRSE